MLKKIPYFVSLVFFVILGCFLPTSAISQTTNDSIVYKLKHGSEFEKKDAFLDLAFDQISTDLDSAKILLDSARNWISDDEHELLLRMSSVSGTYYMHAGKHDLAIEYYKKGLAESLKTNLKTWQLIAYSDLGTVYTELGNTDSALKYLEEGLVFAKDFKENKYLAKINYDLAWVNIRRNFSDKALEYAQKAEEYSLQLKDSFQLVNVYNAYFSLYKNNGDFETSLKYSKKAIAMASRYKQSESTLANLYNNLGVAYWQILNDYDSSRYYLQKANLLYESNSKATNYFLSNLVNLGGMEIQSGNPQKGLDYLNEALEIVYPLEDKFKICALKINMGLAYVQLQNVDSAKFYLYEGIQLAQEISANEFMLNAYVGLYGLDSLQGDFQSALQNFRMAQSISDKISNENTKNRIAELEIIHETAEKEKENQFLQNENQLKEALILKQRIVYTIIIISLMLILVFMGLLLRNKRKLKVVNEELKKKNIEVSDKNNIIEEKNENLEIQKDELITLNHTKDKFFTIVSHDLRGPFNSLLGLLDILEEDFNKLNDTEKLKIIKRLHSNSRNTYNMLVNLLEWSRTQRGLIKPNFMSIPLFDSADSSIVFLRQRIEDKKHRLINNIDPSINVKADINLLLSIFNNLLNNCIKFTPEEGEILVSAKRIEDFVELEITDNGIGIPKEQQDKMFKLDSSFNRKGTNDELGTGLGLLTCKEFVSLMNGTCRLESEEGVGTSFFIKLMSA